MFFHHAMPIEFVSYDAIDACPSFTRKPVEGWPEHDEHWKEYIEKTEIRANNWLADNVGFYPHFLSVGEGNDALYMTGYDRQWGRVLTSSRDGNTYRKAGEFPNCVLFSWDDLDGAFVDYGWWFMALNARDDEPIVSDYYRRLILKPSWSSSKWKRHAKKNPGDVMFVTGTLDLRSASSVRCRNQKTKRLLEKMGFDNVETFRLKMLKW